MTLFRKLQFAALSTATLTVAAILSEPLLNAQAASSPAPDQTQTQAQMSSSNTANDAGQTTAAAYAAGVNSVPDPRTPPSSKPGALTLAQVLDLARAKNPTILAAEQNLRAVRAQEIQAGVRQNPNLGVTGSNITEDNYTANPYDYSVQLSRLFERGDKRKWRLEDARATTSQTKAQLQDSIRQTELAVKTAFTHMLIAKESLELASASLKDFGHEVNIANDRFKAGDLGKLDFERLDLQLADFESDEANDIINLRQASDQLQTLIGVESPSADFDIQGDVVPPVVTQTKDQLLQTALTNRPDYAAARFGVAAAEANARLAIANGTADPTLEAEYDRNGTENSAGFSVNIPLRIFDRNQGNKETARFQADASQLTETAARYQVISDVDQAWVGYVQAKRLSDRYGQHYLDESKDVLSISQYAFEHGGIALIDYLDALRDARSTSLNALNAYQQTWLAIHQLSAAAATDIAP
jgi:cobalt-zinc-cadmium efflux system outer membrane protein